MDSFYKCFRLFTKITLTLYFKKIRIEGLENVPKDKPLLVTPNHQNAFMDALLVGAFIPRDLNYLTRSDVFNKWSSPLLRSIHMMPIYRIRDGYSKLSMNDAIFETCKDIFEGKSSVLIFPEGNHGEWHYLRPLTKGGARLALQSENESQLDLHILPVGLNYFNHQAPRSTVVLKFGLPIAVRDYLKTYQAHSASGLLQLRDRMSEGMKDTLIIPNETDNYERLKNAIFNQENEHCSFEELKSIEPDSQPKQDRMKKNYFAKVLNPIPFLIIQKIIGRVEDHVFHSSLKFATGLFLFPLWWILVLVFFSVFTGFKIAALTVFVMVFGLFYTYRS